MNSQMIESTLGTFQIAGAFQRLRRKAVRLTPIVGGSQAQKTMENRSTLQLPNLVEWYRILRAHHQWTVFQAIRYALWLAR
jgi:hypothetical protein